MRCIVKKAMSHSHVPTLALPRGDVCERVESWLVFLHGAAPHDELEIWELDHLTIEGRDDLHVGTRLRKIVPVVDRVGVEAVVIAGQDHNGQRRVCQHAGGAIYELERHTVMVEDVTGQQEDAGSGLLRGADHLTKGVQVIAAVIEAEVQIGTVNQDEIVRGSQSAILALQNGCLCSV